MGVAFLGVFFGRDGRDVAAVVGRLRTDAPLTFPNSSGGAAEEKT